MKLYKTTIVILSEYDPTGIGPADLARDAEQGDSYCYSITKVAVNCTDLEGEGVKEFFNCLEKEDD